MHLLIFPVVLSIFVATVSVITLDGFGSRYFSEKYRTKIKKVSYQTNAARSFSFICEARLLTIEDIKNKDCVVGYKKALGHDILVWGDSNAAHYVGMLHVFAKHEKYKFKNLSASSCPPLRSDPQRFVTRKVYESCRESLELIDKSLSRYSTVIIAAAWSNYTKRDEVFLEVFFDTVNSLVAEGKRVILLGRVPIFSSYNRKCKKKAISLKVMDCDIPKQPIYRSIAKVNLELEAFARSIEGVSYYDANDTLCPNGQCSVADKNGRSLYYNSSHLAYYGARKLGNDIYRSSGVPDAFKRSSILVSSN